jgi:hypothetical protein
MRVFVEFPHSVVAEMGGRLRTHERSLTSRAVGSNIFPPPKSKPFSVLHFISL